MAIAERQPAPTAFSFRPSSRSRTIRHGSRFEGMGRSNSGDDGNPGQWADHLTTTSFWGVRNHTRTRPP